MRDAGFDFYWTDKYAENLVARGFEARPGSHSTIVAFEVLEHLEDPLGVLKAAKAKFGFDTCFFSATCFDEDNVPDEDWWYWAFETGQHISFFSERTLHWLGARAWNAALAHSRRRVCVFILALGAAIKRETSFEVCKGYRTTFDVNLLD